MVIRLMFVNADESIRWLEDAAHRANIQDNLMLFNAAHNKLTLLRTPKYLIGTGRGPIKPRQPFPPPFLCPG